MKNGRPPKSVRLDYTFIIGIIVGAVFLYISLRKVDFSEMLSIFARIRWSWIIAALLLYYLTYVVRMLRWRYLMLPIRKARYRNLFSAIAIGFGVNNMYPMHLGELARAYALAKTERIRASSVLATIAVERVFDTLTVVGMLIVVLLFVTFPSGYEKFKLGLRTAGIIAMIIAGAFIVLIVLERKRSWVRIITTFLSRPIPVKTRERIDSLMTAFIHGLSTLYLDRKLIGVVIFSVIIWAMITAFYWIIVYSFGTLLPLMAAVFLTVMLAFAVTIPAPPGYIGTFHAAARYALVFFGLPVGEAMSMGVVMHAMMFIPAIGIGLLFIWLDAITISEVTRKKRGAETIKGRRKR